jgi:mono/diheme cytochrome c family protein
MAQPGRTYFSGDFNGKRGSEATMKTGILAVAVLTLVVTLIVLAPSSAWAGEDGAAIFKAKCSPCHGADAMGKPAIKAPSLVGDDAKKMTDDQITDMIANGGKEKKATHAFSKKGLTPDQIKALVTYIRSLQK